MERGCREFSDARRDSIRVCPIDGDVDIVSELQCLRFVHRDAIRGGRAIRDGRSVDMSWVTMFALKSLSVQLPLLRFAMTPEHPPATYHRPALHKHLG